MLGFIVIFTSQLNLEVQYFSNYKEVVNLSVGLGDTWYLVRNDHNGTQAHWPLADKAVIKDRWQQECPVKLSPRSALLNKAHNFLDLYVTFYLYK